MEKKKRVGHGGGGKDWTGLAIKMGVRKSCKNSPKPPGNATGTKREKNRVDKGDACQWRDSTNFY